MTSTHPAPLARTHVAVWTWLVLGVVVALLGTLLLVKVVGGSSATRTQTALAATSPEIFGEVTGVPATVVNAVGVASPVVPVVPPDVVVGGATLTARRDDGVRRPVVLYLGAEYCSFCASERWPLIVALSRFGTFNTLYDMQSSSTDFAPNTPTFSFFGTTYTSRYVVFHPYEVASDLLGPHGYLALMHVPHAVLGIQRRFDPTMTYPFVDVANRVVALQAALSPETFVGVTREGVASALADATNPVTRGIVAAANELTAAICSTDRQRPSSVCHARGVVAAALALNLR